MNPFLIIFTVLNILATIINILTLSKMSEIEADVIVEKAGLINATKNTVMPIAEVKAQFSEEDMKKIKELLNNVKPGTVKLGEPEEKKCECDHLYDSIMLVDDPMCYREKLVFHCSLCNHEEIIPIRRGLLADMISRGGRI